MNHLRNKIKYTDRQIKEQIFQQKEKYIGSKINKQDQRYIDRRL